MATTASWSAPAIPTSTSSCRSCGCSSGLPPSQPSPRGATCAGAATGLPAASALLVFGSSFVFAVIYPALFQRFYVKPSELQLETPYIEHNIALTRTGLRSRSRSR